MALGAGGFTTTRLRGPLGDGYVNQTLKNIRKATRWPFYKSQDSTSMFLQPSIMVRVALLTLPWALRLAWARTGYFAVL
jgi:hypothetical protein